MMKMMRYDSSYIKAIKARAKPLLLITPVFFCLVIFSSAALFAFAWMCFLAVAAWEWGRLMEYRAHTLILYAVLSSVPIGIFAIFWQDTLIWTWRYLSVSLLLWIVCIPALLAIYDKHRQIVLADWIFPLLGVVFLNTFFIALIICRNAVGGTGLLGLFFIIWMNDIGAYFVGKFFGTTSFAPSISPRKTWEGFLGGLALGLFTCLIFMIVFRENFETFAQYSAFFLVSMLAIVYANVGDLFESMLKRRIGVKDSSNLLSGHGGLLDRCDSWLPAMVIWATFFLF